MTDSEVNDKPEDNAEGGSASGNRIEAGVAGEKLKAKLLENVPPPFENAGVNVGRQHNDAKKSEGWHKRHRRTDSRGSLRGGVSRGGGPPRV